jgi:predicted permease
MQAILAVTIPFFGLVLLGWVAARLHWLPASAIPGLNGYVLFFALPCLLFRFGSACRSIASPIRCSSPSISPLRSRSSP